ncbi:MAG: hypothetical protein ABH807_00540 [Candidatus Shapirobacteria bacterium]
MIDLTPTINLAQIAFAFGLLSVAVLYYVFAKKPLVPPKKSKK